MNNIARWYRINVGLGIVGILVFIVSMLFFRRFSLFILSAMFGAGIAFKCIKNIYKGEVPNNKKVKRPNYNKKKK